MIFMYAKDFLSSGKYKTIILINNKLNTLVFTIQNNFYIDFKPFSFKKVLTL